MSGLPEEAFAKPEPTYPCKVCGRKFKKDTLAKHEKACKKVSKPRKAFDAGKQRAGPGSDITYNQVQKAQKEIQKGAKMPKSNWREKHEDFISSVRAARQVDAAIKNGSPLPPPPKSHIPSDYVQCPHCERRFNQSAADRHIPFCAEKTKKNAPMKGPPRGSAALKARAQVNIPPPGTRQPKPGANAKSSIPKPEPRARRSSSLPRHGTKELKGVAPRGRSPVASTTRNMGKLNIRK